MISFINKNIARLLLSLKDIKIKKRTIILLISLFIIGLLIILLKYCNPHLLKQCMNYLFVKVNIIDLLAFCLIAFIIIFTCFGKLSTLKRIVKYRYLIVTLLFAVMVLLKINMGSGNSWDRLFLDKTSNVLNNGLIFGTSRPVRSDEWFVQTPYLLSQSIHGFPEINNAVGGTGQSMMIVPGLVKDLTLIGRPNYWGFILLGTEYGYSWNWCFPILLLFMVSFELCSFLSKENTRLSIIGAFWLTLSPTIQWMIQGVTGSIHPLLWSQCIIVSLIYLFKEVKKENGTLLKKIGYSLCLMISLIAFILNLYPTWQIPVGYIVIAFVIAFIIMNKKEKVKFKLADNLVLYSSILLAAFVILWFYLKNKDVVQIITNTSYPGTRINKGGDYNPLLILKDITSAALPYKELAAKTLTNNGDASSFIGFLPFVLTAFPFMIKKLKDQKPLVIILFVVLILQLSWVVVPYPDWFGSITLFKYVKTRRILYPIGQISVYLCIVFIATLQDSFRLKKWQIVTIGTSMFACYAVSVFLTEIYNYLGLYLSIALIALYVFIIISVCVGFKKTFSLLMLSLIFISGATINPICFGLSPIYGKDEAKAINTIVKHDPDSKWIALNNYLFSQYLLANGAKTINAVQYYPNLKFWSQFDPKGEYTEIYNRYASIPIDLTKNATTFVLTYPDQFLVKLNVEDLIKTGATYLFVNENISAYATPYVKFTEVYHNQKDNVFIFKVDYKHNTPNTNVN